MKKRELIGLHVLFWVFIANLAISLNMAGVIVHPDRLSILVWGSLLSLLAVGLLFYSAYFSFPFFIKNKRRFFWLLVPWVILILAMIFQMNRHNLAPKSFQILQAITGPTKLISFIILGFIFRALVNGIQDGRLKRQLEKEKLTTQLELLKSQINPHFLFNTLNNIDILIKEDPDRASQFLNKLSDILRYSLYETKQEVVPLENELDNIRKYIELQKIRTENPSFASLTVKGDPEGLTIPPMTFLPFVENAFKHSTNKKIEDAIVMTMEVEPEFVTFTCRNHCGGQFKLDENSSGLGMSLIRSRFELLFKDRYTLDSRKNGDWYEVNLKIQLHDR